MTHASERQHRVRSTGAAALAALFLSTIWLGTGATAAPVPGALVVAQAPDQDDDGSDATGGDLPTGAPAPDGYEYDPAQRRDPFNPLVKSGANAKPLTEDLPPLQRIGVTEISLIGIIWGGFGYTAMVQTPDGKGYAVRRGTRIGPNNGIVSKVSENSIVVTERFTDLYGKEQEREYVKLLHSSEDVE